MDKEQKMEEVRKAMKSLGFREGRVELVALDDIRVKVMYDGHLNIGIYDFVKHTFVD